ncbi:rod shape-determining protein MreC [Sphingomonas hankyongi]|uniref:Cell shape-determining protein MreC n=1 Tax=Sphingomonas hankyongi TaxID=2908209 RepID=A0ABT0S330_9SPHN|nr:rod shape-determining protein MreC [Sphingomonas hankyongi]
MAAARPGWSRRAQYGLFFSLLAVIAGIVVGLVLLAMSLVAPKTFDGIRGAALDITGPIASALHEVTATANGLVGGAGNYWDAARQNAELKRENKAMLQRMVEAKAIVQENRQLKATLQLRERTENVIAVGRIVGSSFNSPRRFAILSVGAKDGVQIGMPVRSPDGLVGRVIDAGILASRVLLVSDRANIVPARLLRGGIPVISQGRGDGTIDVRPLEVGRNPFKRGDIIITSGTGGLYPPLVPIARVVKLDDDGAVALPLADPANTSFALVQPSYEPAAVAAETAPAQDAP